MKTCPRCKQTFTNEGFSKNKRNRDGLQSYCRECHAVNQREWRGRNPEKASAITAAYYRVDRYRRYGLTREAFDELLTTQGGVCAICRTDSPGKRDWRIDHDHTCCPGSRSCGACVRGLLCNHCNVGIGMLKDSPEILRRAVEYVS